MPRSFSGGRRARRRSSGRRPASRLRTPCRTCTRTNRCVPHRQPQAARRSARTPIASRAPSALAAPLPDVEHGQERLLRNLHGPDLLHALLALLLVLEQLALARDVAAVALREHVLAPRLHGLARDHTRADRSLDGNVEHLPRDLLTELLDQQPSAVVRE